jgi:hypothetical protein
MPLTEKGQKIMSEMKEKYGEEKGESVFHASKNAGTITGVDQAPSPHPAMGGATPAVPHVDQISGAPPMGVGTPGVMTVADIQRENERFWSGQFSPHPNPKPRNG